MICDVSFYGLGRNHDICVKKDYNVRGGTLVAQVSAQCGLPFPDVLGIVQNVPSRVRATQLLNFTPMWRLVVDNDDFKAFPRSLRLAGPKGSF
jgi:hypothetical protein